MLAAARLTLLFIHVLAFACALGCVLREDVKLLSSEPFDPDSLHTAARTVRLALLMLWASGLALVALDTGGVVARLMQNPKLLAKLSVVCVLTINGVALHARVFPSLVRDRLRASQTASDAACLGAISAVSWLSATLLGISPPAAKWLSYQSIVICYLSALAIGIVFATVIVRPRILRKLQAGAGSAMDVRLRS